MTEIEKRKDQVIKAAKQMLHGKNTPDGIKALGDLLNFTELLEEAERKENEQS